MNVTLWIVQGLLALAFIAVGAMKGSAHAKYSLRRSTDYSVMAILRRLTRPDALGFATESPPTCVLSWVIAPEAKFWPVSQAFDTASVTER